MPSIKDKEAFNKSVGQLRDQICNPMSSGYLMKDAEEKIPVDGLPLFIENSWTQIRSDKDINLPSQKELISNLRCIQIKNEAISNLDHVITTYQSECKHSYQKSFRRVSERIIREAIDYYREKACNYSQNIFEHTLGVLEKEINDILYAMFQDQVRILDNRVYDKWIQELKYFVKKDSVSTHFQDRVCLIVRNIMEAYKEELDKLQLKNLDWNFEEILKNLLSRLSDYASSLQESELEKLHQISKAKLEKLLGDRTHKLLVELDQDFWKNLTSSYEEIVRDLAHGVEFIMTNGFRLNREESKERIERMELDGHKALKCTLMRECDDLNSILRNRFSSLFNYNERGATRNWKSLKEDQIEALFVQTKQNLLKCLSEFAYFKIFPGSGLNPRISKGFSVAGADGIFLEAKRLDKIKARFDEDTELLYDQAKNKHDGKNATKIPWYFWAIAIFFGYDKAVSYLFSPLLQYPLYFGGAVIGVLYSLGLGGVVLEALRQLINRKLRHFNLNFNI